MSIFEAWRKWRLSRTAKIDPAGRRPFVVVRRLMSDTWTKADSLYLRQFLKSETGRRLVRFSEDWIAQAALPSRAPRGGLDVVLEGIVTGPYAAGAAAMLDYVLRMGNVQAEAPGATAMREEEELAKADGVQTATMPDEEGA